MSDSGKRIARTVFQSVLSVASVLLVIVPIVLEHAEKALTPEQYAVLAGGAASVVAVAGVVARFMQAAPVVAFIDTYLPFLSAAPTETVPAVVESGHTEEVPAIRKG